MSVVINWTPNQQTLSTESITTVSGIICCVICGKAICFVNLPYEKYLEFSRKATCSELCEIVYNLGREKNYRLH